MSFHTIPEILEDLRQGRMVVILDDEDRENEGDIVMAAEKVRPEDVNFMVREARGLLCLTLTERHTRQLGLKPMVSDNTSPYHTNFTVSIEAAEGVTTGISAQDRAHTIRVAAAKDAKPADITMPGHIFPLTAQAGGVLSRAGHTEAGCDLAALAGLEPSSVLIEILHDDGSMARRPELEIFAAKHGLKIGTIADLIRYRLETEKTVERVHEEDVDTEFGAFRLVAFRDAIRDGLHFALVRGDVADGEPVLTRVHVRNTLSDVLHLKRDDLGQTVTDALRRIDEADRGVLVVLSGGDTAESLLGRLKRDVAPTPAPGDDQEWRQLGLGAQILADLGVRQLRVMGTPRRFVGIAGFGLEVVEQAG
ncbi:MULTISPECIES: 3,4-dihydroxy-2-butanone-4-phosphate synthase [Rhodanobacteraceae]|uniref:3,4-dihydroxy-2-butanone-4-phosphate synthase n=1 Tax=Rhodanobacteraceae TaxID=1775411 RepID=UPI00088C4AF1|nr:MULTISPECIES: 3,4-dihydroxy-2-butanone-4-phosphate synthase [Rhodanobacteraceae]MDR6643051.1 3,4-dihydroxy 2-butanone 4-phosphate synthase/GTP cyclohydrolase II [Luteibacter sp. 1214]SDF92724.1 GTP cyclohydrolase II /3,4-dihydroxy-2-butanone 4-phosphate synthase [Dyella sp. 333MFSha]SKB94073.1 GTP cyclohydrolase II [Luteibacter sp. 22Crub2.1]